MRKVIQITTDSQPDSSSWEAWCCLTALCDDGTIWELMFNKLERKRVWEKLPEIPQVEEG